MNSAKRVFWLGLFKAVLIGALAAGLAEVLVYLVRIGLWSQFANGVGLTFMQGLTLALYSAVKGVVIALVLAIPVMTLLARVDVGGKWVATLVFAAMWTLVLPLQTIGLNRFYADLLLAQAVVGAISGRVTWSFMPVPTDSAQPEARGATAPPAGGEGIHARVFRGIGLLGLLVAAALMLLIFNQARIGVFAWGALGMLAVAVVSLRWRHPAVAAAGFIVGGGAIGTVLWATGHFLMAAIYSG